MKIERVEWYPRDLPRKERFVTSRHASEVAQVVFVRVDADGLEGWGAASPSDVTGEWKGSGVEGLPKLGAELPGGGVGRRAREGARGRWLSRAEDQARRPRGRGPPAREGDAGGGRQPRPPPHGREPGVHVPPRPPVLPPGLPARRPALRSAPP